MNEKIPEATHIGELKIGDIAISCAVLEDGTRVLSQASFLRAIGRVANPRNPRERADNGFVQLPVFLASDNLKPFITGDLVESSKAVKFRPIRGGMSIGYKAEILPLVCNVFLEANDAKALRASQLHIYQRCKMLMRGFAIVGITALVDEATGYQEVRDKLALQAILDKFLRIEFARWAKRFPDEFYKEMFRLKGWEWNVAKVKRPSVVGRYTNDLVYERILPTLLKELQNLNPKDEKGHRKHKHHQWLTDDVGHPKLQEHIYAVLGLMRASVNWEQFYRMLQRAFPKFGHSRLLPFVEAD